MNIDHEYFAACLKVVEVLSQDFAPEIMATITKIIMLVKGIQESKFSCKIKHFQEKAKKILDPFVNNNDNMYAVVTVDDLAHIGIHAAAVVEDNGFCRKVVYTTCSGGRAAMKFVNSIVKKIYLDDLESSFIYSSKNEATDLAENYVDTMVCEAAKADKTVIVNRAHDAMQLNEDVATEFTVE